MNLEKRILIYAAFLVAVLLSINYFYGRVENTTPSARVDIEAKAFQMFGRLISVQSDLGRYPDPRQFDALTSNVEYIESLKKNFEYHLINLSDSQIPFVVHKKGFCGEYRVLVRLPERLYSFILNEEDAQFLRRQPDSLHSLDILRKGAENVLNEESRACC